MIYSIIFDVGNSNIKMALVQNGLIKKQCVFAQTKETTEEIFKEQISFFCKDWQLDSSNCKCICISSVVPNIENIAKIVLKEYFSCPVLFIPKDFEIPLENTYPYKEECGADLLVGLFAARNLYKEKNIIVVDFGTATTFSCMKENTMLGALIFSGLEGSTKALTANAAKIPNISLVLENTQIDITAPTESLINQGMLHGFASVTEGLCKRLEETLGGKMYIVATGGFSQKVAKVCSYIDIVEPNLLLHGLAVLSEKFQSEKI